MSTTQPTPADAVARQRDAFIERFLQFASGTFNIFAIYLGDRLGLYRALAEAGPSTAAQLAARTRTHERYVREWLEQQTVAGILEVEDEDHAPDAGTGTVMRADTLQRYALEAGFSRVEILPIDNFFFRFYRLHA